MKRETITAATCVTCGLCCVSFTEHEVYCDITEEDEKRLGKRFVRLHVLQHTPFDAFRAELIGRRPHYAAIKTKWVENKAGPFKGISACRCVALAGSLGHKVSCRVYAKRPSTCRKAVKPGDRACRDIRRIASAALEDAEESTKKMKTVGELREDLAKLQVDDATRSMFEGMLDRVSAWDVTMAAWKAAHDGLRAEFESHEHACGQYPCVCGRCP